VGSRSVNREIVVKPIGVVHTPFSDEGVKDSLCGVEGFIEVSDGFDEGLEAIEGFSHIIVVAFLDRVTGEQRRVLKVRFRRLLRFGVKPEELPEVGVFCSDSPHRPNPIAISIVELKKREGPLLHVKGLDLFEGTPVLDLKPYTPDRMIQKTRLPRWYEELERKVAERTGVENPRL